MISGLTAQTIATNITHGVTGSYFLKRTPKLLTMILLTCFGIVSIYMGGIKIAILLILLIVVVPPTLSVIWKTQIGIYILITASFFLSIGLRILHTLPLGLFLDILILLMVLGKAFQLQYNRQWNVLKSPLTSIIIVWAIYNLAQFVNPWAASRSAYFYVIRPAVGYLLIYFLIWDTVKASIDARKLFNYVLFLGTIAAIWGIYQFYFGYFDWEMAHILRTDTVHLVFNNGRWRSFGPIGSPAQFGIIMASLACITGNSFFYKKDLRSKMLMGLLFLLFLLAMVYSGTRSSFVILPIFFFTKVLISRNRKLYVTLLLGIIALVILAKIPSSNYQIQRIQSIFKANSDKSYQIRAANRKMITPWIIKHPVGGGLGSTGVWGQRFSPGTFLANFPPDSGIIRVAVELGWIGLIIFLLLYFQSFFKGIQGVWKMKENDQRATIEGIVCLLPAWALVELGQEVAGVFPMSILFWVFLAVLFSTIDKQKNEIITSH